MIYIYIYIFYKKTSIHCCFILIVIYFKIVHTYKYFGEIYFGMSTYTTIYELLFYGFRDFFFGVLHVQEIVVGHVLVGVIFRKFLGKYVTRFIATNTTTLVASMTS